MKRKLKVLLLTGLLAAALLAVSACGSVEFDASGYVKSFMDMLTKGETKDYAKFTGQSEEEAKKEYKEFTDAMMKPLGTAGLSEDVQMRFRDVFIKIFAKSKYTVKEAKKVDDDQYTVDVVIEPIQGIYDGLSQELENKTTDYVQEAAASGQQLDEAAITEWVFNTMIDMMEERLNSITYGEPTTVTVKVYKDGNVYKIEDEEAVGEKIGQALIDQSGMQ